MCGIAGKISLDSPVTAEELQRAGDSIRHRGPDDHGIYISPDGKAGLSHRRLSFLDLTPAGHQPMFTADGELGIIFNGEIYNYLELKEILVRSGAEFRTTSDTEVILLGYRYWGQEVLQKLKGMFAFAILDLQKKNLVLARDRFGIKPLYYAKQGNSFFFGSEVKAIRTLNGGKDKVRQASVSTFLANRYVAGNYTMWEDILRLGPGCFMEIDTQTLQIREHQYWKLSTRTDASAEEVFEKFSQKLERSVKEHLRSDVQVGSFLSGGFDSSALVALMRKLDYPTRAFSIGFKGWKESEDIYAKIVAEHTGAKLDTLHLDRIDLGVVAELMYHYDDPIADISILPTYAVSGLAAKHVKAVVSGEGSDELLGGYWWHKPENFYYGGFLQRWIGKSSGITKKQVKNHYIRAMSMGLFDTPELKKALDTPFHAGIPDDPFSHFDGLMSEDLSVLKQLQYLDIYTFMSELILTKVDRAAMAHSLEVRVPFLDHELVEYLFSLPESAYFEPGKQKPLLQKLLTDLVPAKILERPKQGFVGPDVFYMDFELYSKKLRAGRLIKDGVIRKKYVELLFLKRDHWRLWKLFVLENWWQKWL